MIFGLRYRPVRLGELRAFNLGGLVPEAVPLRLSKSDVVARLTEAIERGDLEPRLLATVDSAVPMTVLEQLGFTASVLRKAEALGRRRQVINVRVTTGPEFPGRP